jgi:probable F420-dependent oxidoreductase
MRFGLIYDFRNPAPWRRPFPELYRETLEQIAYAEDLGFDDIWLTEHHFVEDGYCPSLLTAAAAIAVRTKRVRIGTWVLLLPLHHALRVAEDAAVVDILSHGRLDLGVGLGYRIEEFAAFGVDRRHRKGLMDEGCAIIRRAWTEDNWSFAGRHYHLENVSVQPKPVQDPCPLWIGARSEVAARRAARFESPLMLVGDREVYDAYAAALRERGRDPRDFTVHGRLQCYVTDDPERTRALMREQDYLIGAEYDRWYKEAGDLVQDRERRVQAGPDEIRPGTVLGDAATCIRAIEEWRGRGVPFTHLAMWGTRPGVPTAEMTPYLERFAREVMPHFRRPAGAAPGRTVT